MKANSITLQAFKSFDEKTTFRFGDKSGLYNLRGVNEREPDLDGNGVGKSTIIDALLWVCYGKTVDGLRAGNVHTWESKRKTEVSFDFNDSEDKQRILFRSWKPAKLTLDGKDVTQDTVIDVLGKTYEMFLKGIVLGQGSETIFDLKPTAALDLLTDIMSLDKWDRYRDRARLEVSRISDNIIDIEKRTARILGRLDTLKSASYSDSIEEWEDDREKKLTAAKKSLASANEGIELSSADVSVYSDRLNAIEEVAEPDTETLYHIKDKMSDERGKVKSILRQIAEKKKELEKFSNLGGVCPHCGNKVKTRHKKEVMSEYEDDIDALEKRKSKIESKIRRLSIKLDAATDSIKILKEQRDSYIYRVTTAQRELDETERKHSDFIAAKREATEKISDLASMKNPYLGKQNALKKDIKLAEDDMREQAQELKINESLLENTKYWVNGFRDIKLYLTANMLTAFEIEVNRAIMSLGMKEWSVNLVVEQETKSRTISRGFTVIVNSPETESPVPLATLSGGEAQRLKLAGTLGIMSLIQSVNGTNCDLIILDEPSTHLSKAGVKDLLETLKTFAHENDKRIICVDHALPEFPYDGETNIMKDDRGSRFCD